VLYHVFDVVSYCYEATPKVCIPQKVLLFARTICIIPAEHLSSNFYEFDALSLLIHGNLAFWYGFGLHSLEFLGWLGDLDLGRRMGMYFTHTDDTKTRSLYI